MNDQDRAADNFVPIKALTACSLKQLGGARIDTLALLYSPARS